MKRWIVTARCGVEMFRPMVFKTKEEAEQDAYEFVYGRAEEEYREDQYWDEDEEDDKTPIPMETLEAWAEEKCYELYEYYYWDGGNDAYEAEITEVEI